MSIDQNDTSAEDRWDIYTGKYKDTNPIARYLTHNFFQQINRIVSSLEHNDRLLEVGCGPGESTRRILEMLQGQHFEASEFEQDLVELHIQNNFPIPVQQESVYELNRADNSFDCVILLEVLEHLEDYQRALEEIFRVARKSVIVSVPNEPLWRILNMLRGKYWNDWGNTPGHINHWSTKQFVELVKHRGEIVTIYKPIPWTIVHAKVKDDIF